MKACLMRYIARSIRMRRFPGHAAEWKSYCIYQILKSMGFEIDLLNWKDEPQIEHTYDVVFDVGRLDELSDAFRPDTVKILYLTGGDNVRRNKLLKKRTKRADITSLRLIPEPEAVYDNIELADYVILNGNQTTLHTYPEQYWDKIHLMNGTITPI